ncbi:MAG: response regulator [Acidobacteriota bacterium]
MHLDLYSSNDLDPGGELLAEALAAAKAGNRTLARQLVLQVVETTPQREAAWLLLASLEESPEDVAVCLQQVLTICPDHSLARPWLESVLQGGPLAPPLTEDDADPLGGDGRDREDSVLEQPAEASAPAPQIRGKVLVVDDSPTVRKLVTLVLEALACEVITAANGLEALAKIHSRSPDMVIVDIGLDHIDGHQICQVAKGRVRDREIAVITLTGRDQPHDRARGLAAGADEFLTKPVDANELGRVVERYLSDGGES